MNDFHIILTDESILDLESIFLYISNTLKAPIYGLNQINRIKKEISKLDSFPLRHKIVEWEPWHSKEIHQIPIDNFIIYYLVDEVKKEVNILRIVYSKRNVEEILTKNK